VPADRSYAVISTFPPTPCGVATFSAALSRGLAEGGRGVTPVRVDDEGWADVGAIERPGGRADVVILQHEFGLYSGRDGDSVVDLARSVDVPLIVVAHTVLRSPTAHQRAVFDAVVDAADAVVVMTEAGQRLLVDHFGVEPAKVAMIPHGAAVASGDDRRAEPVGHEVLTWGLLGPGKGIEWAIDAVAELGDLSPQVTYRIAGDTHPKVVRADGDAYRDMLRRRAERMGLAEVVRFDAGYRSVEALEGLIASASVVVLPYDSPDQVTSGVLVDAIAAGRPVIATAFPHAVELLASGAGLVVPRRDPGALAAALRRVLTEPGLASAMAAEARRLAPGLAWGAVASRYAALGDALAERGVVTA
jgi:glycosyltransferase involved in cell wall biosynthesis